MATEMGLSRVDQSGKPISPTNWDDGYEMTEDSTSSNSNIVGAKDEETNNVKMRGEAVPLFSFLPFFFFFFFKSMNNCILILILFFLCDSRM